MIPTYAHNMAVPNKAALIRSVVSAGDAAPLKHVFGQAREGKPVLVAVIGGSITGGAAASHANRTYANCILAWWKDRFPKARITLVNAGVGATGSNYGAFRAQRDLLSKKPDFVVIEYACNDQNRPAAELSYEGLIRQVLSQPQHPAVLLLFMTHKDGTNNQAQESAIGSHYHLPMISYQDALWSEIQSGTLKYDDCQADEVHPNDAGHAYAASLVTTYLAGIADLPSDPDAQAPAYALPAPLHSDIYQFTRLYEPKALQPSRTDGWTLNDAGYYTADKPGSVFECDVEGQSVSLLGWRIRGAMGKIRAQVDDRPPVDIDGWFAATWGGYLTCDIISEGLPAGRHHIHIELLDQKDPGSTGYEYRLYGFGTAGVKE